VRPVPRTTVTCAVPRCGRQIALTQWQLDHRKQQPACSRPHARLLRSLDGIRDDPVGAFLRDLVIAHGGMDVLAQRLDCHRTDLQLLMRTPGRIPYAPLMRRLAEASERSLKDVSGIFGRRTDPRTAEIIAVVREKFSHDRVRLAVADRIERECGTVRAYAAAVDLDEDTVRVWLLGKHDYLEEPILRAIAVHEKLPPRLVATTLRKAKRHWGKSLTKARKKLFRRKRHHRSDHMQQALSESKTTQWADPEWRQGKGENVIRTMHDGRLRAWADEERYLAHLMKREIGHFRSRYQSADSTDVLWVLCRILRVYRQRFPASSLVFEALLERVQAIMGKSVHALLRARGHPHDVSGIAGMVRLFDKTPRPDPFWPEASMLLYGTRDRADGAGEWWDRVEKSVSEWIDRRTAHPPVNLMHRLFEAILGRMIDRGQMRDMLRIPPGRPGRTPSAPV